MRGASASGLAVFLGKFLADTLASETVVPIGNGLAVIVDAVERYMYVRMLLVEVPPDDVLRILDAHPLHILTGNLRYDCIVQPWCIFLGKAQNDMPDCLCNPRIHLSLTDDTLRYCVVIFYK